MNIAQVVGLGAAVDYLDALGMENVREHERGLGEYAYRRLSEIGDITVYGPGKNRTGLVSFCLPDVHPHDLSQLLDEEGVAMRAASLRPASDAPPRRRGDGSGELLPLQHGGRGGRTTSRHSNVPASSSELSQDEYDARALHADTHGPLSATPAPGRTGETMTSRSISSIHFAAMR